MPGTLKFLVPLDGSPLAEVALSHVERLAEGARLQGEGVRVHLVAVVPASDPGSAWPQTYLAGVQRGLDAQGIPNERHIRRSESAGDEIVIVARGLPADLVVMSSHGRGGLLRLVRGSVAEHVLRRSPCPVLLLTPRTQAPRKVERILVPLDGTERSAAVLPLVERIAKAERAKVLLLRVTWDATTRPLLAVYCSADRMIETLTPWKTQLESAGLEVEVRAAEGDAGREILHHAESADVDLIAMATHGHTGMTRLIEGSVTEHVLRMTRRPLLVVRPAPDASGAASSAAAGAGAGAT